MSASRLDAVYRSILLTKFFTKGWGKPENLRRLFEFRKVVSNRDECFKLVDRDYPVVITKEQNLTDCRLLEGYFTTPLERYLPGIVPQVAQRAHFQALLPVHWPQQGCKPVCLHLAGTGDHFFWRRRNLMVKPLLKEAGIGGIILENPFYGLRKPTDQIRSSLHNVSDIFVMGGCLVLEALVLFHWCERNGLGPLGVTGLSMGGHMASLAATNWPKPLVLVPCLSWSTASAVFLQGVMSHSINWDLLEDQYMADGEYKDKLSKMVTIVDEAFLAGKKFARTYTQNVVADTKLDITYKEAQTKEPNAMDHAKKVKNLLELEKLPTNKPKTDTIKAMEKLHQELNDLLKEEKISRVLYEKLTSNEKFELVPSDIDCINLLNSANLKDLLLKCKVAEIKAPPIQTAATDSNLTDTMIPTVLKTSSTSQMGIEVVPIDKKLPHTNTETKVPEKTSEDKKQQTKTEPTTKKAEAQIIISQTKKIETQVTVAKKEVKKEKKRNLSELTSDLFLNLPFMRSGKKIDIGKIHWRDREALQFMRGIMDECTHLSNFSVPYDTSLIIAVCAKHDAYVPRDDVGRLEDIWPGAEVRYVDAGHVSAYILHQSLFRSCIIEAFERSKKKWKDGKHIN